MRGDANEIMLAFPKIGQFLCQSICFNFKAVFSLALAPRTGGAQDPGNAHPAKLDRTPALLVCAVMAGDRMTTIYSLWYIRFKTFAYISKQRTIIPKVRAQMLIFER